MAPTNANKHTRQLILGRQLGQPPKSSGPCGVKGSLYPTFCKLPIPILSQSELHDDSWQTLCLERCGWRPTAGRSNLKVTGGLRESELPFEAQNILDPPGFGHSVCALHITDRPFTRSSFIFFIWLMTCVFSVVACFGTSVSKRWQDQFVHFRV